MKMSHKQESLILDLVAKYLRDEDSVCLATMLKFKSFGMCDDRREDRFNKLVADLRKAYDYDDK
jgi:hypothetical protein